MSRPSSSHTPIKVSYADDSNCQLRYSYNDPLINDNDYYMARRYDARVVYIVESQYTCQALLEWDSRRARLDRKVFGPKSKYHLPQGDRGDWRPVAVWSLILVYHMAAHPKVDFDLGAVPHLCVDEENRCIWAPQPFTRIVPAKDIVILTAPPTTRTTTYNKRPITIYKAIIPSREWRTGRSGFKQDNNSMIVIDDKPYLGRYTESQAFPVVRTASGRTTTASHGRNIIGNNPTPPLRARLRLGKHARKERRGEVQAGEDSNIRTSRSD